MKGEKPIRLRDFVEDADGWLYAVSTYDNSERAGCILRYVPDEAGERVTRDGRRYRKVDFDEAYSLVAREKPAYLDVFHRIPLPDISRVLKPEEEIETISQRDARVMRLLSLFSLPPATVGCTGSFLCGLENNSSDIDLVVYGRHWFRAVEILRDATENRTLDPIDEETWRRIFKKRNPELDFDEFLLHEKRKWNRGKVGGTYFDVLYTRSYDEIDGVLHVKGRVLGKRTIEAVVTDARFSHDSPAVYQVDHDEIASVLSFTHTYSGQAREGEVIQARGVIEEHGDEHWLIVGRPARQRASSSAP